MKLFSKLYDWVLHWAKHRHAPAYLAGVSFAESSFFPVPPDVMLAPMSLARPSRAWYFALITTVASVLGGIAGYFIGVYFFDFITMALGKLGIWNWEKFEELKTWFDEWGIWVVFLAGFTPIPYKIFTITSGFLSLAILPFIIASTVSRGARFFLVAGLVKWGGPSIERKLKQYIDILGWLVIIAIVIGYFVIRG